MREMFRYIQEVKTWMRKEIPDPDDRLYTTYIFIVVGILTLKREEIPATKSEIISLTTVSASTVNRALPILSDLGLLKTDGKVWDFAVVVPDRLIHGDFSPDNNGHIKAILDEFKSELKSTIARMKEVKTATDSVILDDDLDEIMDIIDKTEPKQGEKKGAKGLMGDALL